MVCYDYDDADDVDDDDFHDDDDYWYEQNFIYGWFFLLLLLNLLFSMLNAKKNRNFPKISYVLSSFNVLSCQRMTNFPPGNQEWIMMVFGQINSHYNFCQAYTMTTYIKILVIKILLSLL